MKYKIAILGAGPGGYVAAIRAAQLGAGVCVIEKEHVGGTCLNWGCIPTKTLLATAEVIDHAREAAQFGVEVPSFTPDPAKIGQRKEAVVGRLRNGIETIFKKRGITLIRGTGRLTGPGAIAVETADGGTETVEAENIILATGSVPLVPPVFNYDGKRIITSNEALALSDIPDELLIVGGSVVGCEFAAVYSALGSRVTIIEMLPKLVPTEDDEVSRRFTMVLKKKKVKVKTGTAIAELKNTGDGVTAVLADGTSISAGKALVAIGRRPVTDDIGLETVGLTTEKGMISVDEYLKTAVDGIYAVGDITGKMLLAHLASAQGICAVENIMGKPRAMDYRVVPRCIFTTPEVASVGITEQEAAAQGLQVKTGKFPFAASGKALAIGQTEGFAKIICDEHDHILGAHILGPHASNLIMELALAMKLNATAEDIAGTIHVHPTLAEAVGEAAEDVADLGIHIL